MTTTMLVWWFTCLALAGPIAILIEYAVWFAWPAQRPQIEDVIAQTYGVTIAVFPLVWTIQLLLSMPALLAFAGPRNRVRDHVPILFHSRTARWCALSWMLTFALIMAIKVPFGPPRAYVILALCAALIVSMIFAGIGLTRVYRTNRRMPYYAGMTEAEKKLADQPRGERKLPSFPDAAAVTSPEDAHRYAGRAKTISETHTWIGAGIIVIFTAFIGTTIAATWESKDVTAWIPAYFVLFALALGFWIQRRARSYDQLRESFESRARELEAARDAAHARPPKRGLIARLFRW